MEKYSLKLNLKYIGQAFYNPESLLENLLNVNYREFLYELSTSLKNWQAVTLLIGEINPNESYPLDVAYTSDGIIVLLNLEQDNNRRRYIEVLKMRGSEHFTGKHAADLSREGFSVQAGLR